MRDRLQAVIWDFDGTLVDTRRKNLSVTRSLFETVRGAPADSCPALRSLASYERALRAHRNWQVFYRDELGMTDDQVNEAGSQWMSFQRRDRTEANLIEGVADVVRELRPIPQGIVSLNARDNILRFLADLGLESPFGEVLGYEAVGLDRQKPAPDALVLCIERLTGLKPGCVLFVGDHAADVDCAHNTNALFASRGLDIEVLAIGVLYGPSATDSWSAVPHLRARDPREILSFIDGRQPGLGATTTGTD